MQDGYSKKGDFGYESSALTFALEPEDSVDEKLRDE